MTGSGVDPSSKKLRTTQHNIALRQGDMKIIMDAFAPQGLSATLIIRLLVASFVDRLKEDPDLAKIDVDIGI